jgi:competence protein ComEA
MQALRRRSWLIITFCGFTPGLRAQLKALEVNQASRAELESLPGLGPNLVERILTERAKMAFSDWADLRQRVRAIGPTSAKKLSALGLRVNGLDYPD